MITWFFFITLLIMWGAFVLNGKSFIQVKRQKYLGIIVPEEYLEHPEVEGLIEKYQKRYKQWFYLAGIGTFITFLFRGSFSLVYVYFTLYLSIMPTVQIYLMYKYQEDMKKVKYKLGWSGQKTHQVYVDTLLSKASEKESKPVFIWLLIPMLLSIYPFMTEHKELLSLQWIFVATSLFTASIGGIIVHKIKKSSKKVYSENHEINQQLNHVIKSKWVYGVVSMIYFQVIANNFLYALLIKSSNPFLVLLVIGLMTFFIVGLLLYINKSNDNLIHKLADQSKLVALDEEDYWYANMFYNNPNNNKLLVSDKTGINTTFNLGKKSGKIFMISSLLLYFVVMIGSCAFIVLEEQLEPKVIFNENSVEFSALIYKDEIHYDDIEDLFLVENLKTGFKTNGSATDTYARGSFNLSDYGATRLYIFKDSRPYLGIKTNNKYYFYSGKEEKETYKIYNTLEDRILE